LANRGFLQIQLKPGQIDVIYMIKRILAICMKRNVALNTFTLREWGRISAIDRNPAGTPWD